MRLLTGNPIKELDLLEAYSRKVALDKSYYFVNNILSFLPLLRSFRQFLDGGDLDQHLGLGWVLPTLVILEILKTFLIRGPVGLNLVINVNIHVV